MKTPKFLTKFSAVLSRPKKAQPKPQKRLQASARAARPAMDDYEEEEPTTKLSSAFIVVLILHVVAVGGIYAFNSIKASRRDHEALMPVAPVSAPASTKAAADSDNASVLPIKPLATNRTSDAATAPAPAVKPAGHPYEIKANDNLTKIALAFNVLPSQIMEANHLKEGAVLKPGQTLIIPAAKPGAKPAVDAAKPEAAKTADAAAAAKAPGTYVVKKSDTFTSIAKATGTTVAELTKANKTVDPTKLQPGQILKIPKKG